MSSRLGRRLGKHQVSFDTRVGKASPSISEDASLSAEMDKFYAAAAADKKDVQYEQDQSSGPTVRTKLAILTVVSGITGGYVWYKAKESDPEYAKQYALIAAAGIVGILGYLLFIKRILG